MCVSWVYVYVYVYVCVCLCVCVCVCERERERERAIQEFFAESPEIFAAVPNFLQDSKLLLPYGVTRKCLGGGY